MSREPSAPGAPDGVAELTASEDARYDTVGELGRGGLGKVALVRDRRLGREVAIKQLVHRSASSRARFVREAQLTAQLEHPAIVPVYDAGVDRDGEPYYAMRKVTGETLAQKVNATATAAERLALVPHVLAAAEALAYAHERHIVHRDLKPSNILVGARGETIVIDWGLARHTGSVPADEAQRRAPTVPVDGAADGGGDAPDGDATRSALPDGGSHLTLAADAADAAEDDGPGATPATPAQVAVTQTGEVIGTPAFMPPEQAAGEPVDARADVYALGATLYFLLAGVAPYAGTGRQVLRQVVTVAPVVLEARAPGVPVELAAIVRHAMAREPAERYADAGALVRDLRRFLSGRLVGAHRYRPWALAWWWLRRHRAIATVVTGAAALLVALGVASVLRIRDEREVARHERALAQDAHGVAAARANRLRLLQARAELERDPTVAAAWLASYQVEPDQLDLAVRVASAAAPSVARDLLPVVGATVQRVCTSPDGRLVLGVDRKGDVYLWDRRGAVVARTLLGSVGEPPAGCRVSASGRLAAVQGRRGALAQLDLVARTFAAVPLKARRATFAGEALIVATPDGELVAIDASGQAPRALGKTPFTVVWMDEGPDGKTLAVTGMDGSLAVWPVGGAPRLLPQHPRPITSIDLLADGAVISASSQLVRIDGVDGAHRELPITEGRDTVVMLAVLADSVLVLDSSSQRLRRWWPDGHLDLVAREVVYDSLSASQDGGRAAWATMDGIVHVFDPATGAVRDLRGHGSGVRDLVISRDGTTIVSSAEDATLRVWEPARPDGAPLVGLAAPATALGASADRTVIVGGDEQGQVAMWRDGVPTVLGRLPARIARVVVSADGTRAAVAAGDDHLSVFDLTTGASRVLSAQIGLMPIGFTAAGEAVALLDDRQLRAWDAAGQARVLFASKAPFVGGTVAPDGRTVITAAFDGVRVIDVATATATALTGPDGAAFRVTVTPDGRTLLAATGAGTLWRWTLGGATAGVTIGQMRGNVTDLEVAPDGATLAVADESGAIALVPLAGGAPRWLYGHDTKAALLAFTPAGRLISADRRGLVRVWHPASGASAVVGEHRAVVRDLLIVGEAAIVSDERGAPRRWHLDGVALAPASAAALEAWSRDLTRVRVDEAAGIVATPLAGD